MAGREADARALAEAERNNLRALFMQAPAAIAVVRGPDFRYELSNPMNQLLVGARSLVGRTVREAVPELVADGVLVLLEQAYRSGETVVASQMPVMIPSTGARAYVNGILQPLRDGHGRVDGVMVFAYEVTDLVEARSRVEKVEQRLRLALDAGQVGTWEYDPLTRVLTTDDRYNAIFGLPPGSKPSPAELAAAIHPEDRERVREAADRSFDPAGGGQYVVEYRVIGITDRRERWAAMRGQTLFDDRGTPIRFVGTGVDITQQRRALEQAQFLVEASVLLASQLDYRATLVQLVRLAVPRLADWCSVEVVDENGELELLEVAHVDPAKVQLARELREKYAPATEEGAAGRNVVRTGKPFFVPEVPPEMINAAARDSEHLELLRRLELRSIMVVPLPGQSRTMGALALVYAESGRRYSEEDLAFAGELARRAGISIEKARLYRAAQVAIEKRDTFLSIASHELRTPLATLQLQMDGFLRRFEKSSTTVESPTEVQTHLVRARKQIDRLVMLVDNLLDVSRLSGGFLKVSKKQMNLRDLVNQVVARFEDSASRVGSRIDVHGDGEVIGLWDPDRLDQVVTNLLGNALKFAAGQPIEIGLENRGEDVRIVVRDRGPGIRPEDRFRIFDRFERTDVAENRAGLGLGLWIAREIVRAHGGEISVDSTLGVGAAFSVDLPRRAPEISR
jgi:PAS domain S-box-containing protein